MMYKAVVITLIFAAMVAVVVDLYREIQTELERKRETEYENDND